MILSRNTDKQWCGCWKGMNANSMTMATISINVNLQQSMKRRKIATCLKKQETSLHFSDLPQSDLRKAESVVFHESLVTLLCASQNPNLTVRLSSKMHATTLSCFKWYILLLEWHPDSSF